MFSRILRISENVQYVIGKRQSVSKDTRIPGVCRLNDLWPVLRKLDVIWTPKAATVNSISIIVL